MVPGGESALKRLAKHPSLAEVRELIKSLPHSRVFLVGGSLRDVLLGGKAKDFDVAITGATPEEVHNALSQFKDARVIFAGATFPVFKFRPTPERAELDIALARTERSTGGGSLQDFETNYDSSVTIEDDLSRRDFTWNAMALDLDSGVLIDPHGGIDDLKSGLVRTVGNALERFEEDRTRALRGIRFAVKLGFKFDPATWEAIKTFAPRMNEQNEGGEVILKRELVGQEFVRSFSANTVKTLDLYDQSGMFESLMPEINVLKYIQQRPDFHPEGDVYIHTVKALQSLPRDTSLTITLSVLLHDIGKATKFQVYDRETKAQIPLDVTPRIFCERFYDPMLPDQI